MDKKSAAAIDSTLFLCLDTAVLFWRAVREGRLPSPAPLDFIPPGTRCATSFGSISRLDLSSLGVTLEREGITAHFHTVALDNPQDERKPVILSVPNGLQIPPGRHAPIHVLTTSRNTRHGQRATRTHLLSGKAPAGSFYRVSEHIAVTSPGLTYLHLSRRGRMLPCLELACEWCGTYALSPSQGGCLFGLEPLLQTKDLHSYLSQKACPRGARQARKVLAHVEDHLASPRETEFFLLLVLPPELGGWGFEKPEVNQVIPLRGTQYAHLSEHAHLEVDLLWRAKRVVVEYDGFFDHERTIQQVIDDKEKRSLLASLGYSVIVVTKRDLESMETLERKVGQIATALGVELPACLPGRREAQAALFNWLFNAAHDHVPFGMEYR